MPLFHRKNDEEKQQEEAMRRAREDSRAQQEASLASIERGGLPLQAQQRLAELGQGGAGFFTSDLTVDEFVLSRQAGFEPISQVMGSSVFHVGWQYLPSGYWSSSGELRVISDAMNRARGLALHRLEQEAMLVGADAVIGVHVERNDYDWSQDLIEFSTVGTAVRLKNAPQTERPGLTNLSGQDFWKLFRSGYWPLGVVAASTVFYVVASWATQMANNSFWGSWANQELQDFTQGLYVARHLTMANIRSQPVAQGSQGVVGMVIEQESEEHEVELSNDQTRTDMIFTFQAMGTAIGELTNHPEGPPTYAVLNLRDA